MKKPSRALDKDSSRTLMWLFRKPEASCTASSPQLFGSLLCLMKTILDEPKTLNPKILQPKP